MNHHASAPTPVPVLDAEAANWHCIDFCSDLHLHADDPDTLAAFGQYLRRSTAQAIFILGDLFEIWIGDDALDDENSGAGQAARACAAMLFEASQSRSIHLLPGNRDFLFGAQAARRCGLTLLSDPTRLDLPGQRVMLSHGDALCLDDVAYQRFRAQVRSPAWQQDFLAQPLAARWQQGRAMRATSTATQRALHEYPDVDPDAARTLLQSADATLLVHGHTHRPAAHALGAKASGTSLERYVLSDWDANAQPPRLEILRWQLGRWQRLPALQA